MRGEEELNRSSRFIDPEAPRPTWVPLLWPGCSMGALFLWLGGAARASARARRWFGALAAPGRSWQGSSGCCCSGSGSSRITGHRGSNENVLLLTPLSLLLVVLHPARTQGPGWSRSRGGQGGVSGGRARRRWRW